MFEKNNLHSIIQHFDFICFTNNIKNASVYKVYIKKFCPKEIRECIITWEDFVNKQLKTTYLRFNNLSTVFELIDIKGTVLSNRENLLRKQVLMFVEPFLEQFGLTKQSMAFFDYLSKYLPSGAISEDDLTLSIKTTNSKKAFDIIEVSIIDLIVYVVMKKLERPPPEDIVKAFKFLQKKYKIPYCFCNNEYFY